MMIGTPRQRTTNLDRLVKRLVYDALPLKPCRRLAHQAKSSVQHNFIKEFWNACDIVNLECPSACQRERLLNGTAAWVNRMGQQNQWESVQLGETVCRLLR